MKKLYHNLVEEHKKSRFQSPISELLNQNLDGGAGLDRNDCNASLVGYKGEATGRAETGNDNGRICLSEGGYVTRQGKLARDRKRGQEKGV